MSASPNSPQAPTAPPPGNDAEQNKSSPYDNLEFEYRITLGEAIAVLRAVSKSLSPAERAALKVVVNPNPVLRKAYAELAAGGELGDVSVLSTVAEDIAKAVENKLAEALRPFRMYKVPGDKLHEIVESVECTDDNGKITVYLRFVTPRGPASIMLKYDEFFDRQNTPRLPPRLIRWLRKYGVQVGAGKIDDLVTKIDKVPCRQLESVTLNKIKEALVQILEEGECAEGEGGGDTRCADIIISGDEVEMAKPHAVKVFISTDLRIRGRGAVAGLLEKLGVLRGRTTHKCGERLVNYYIFDRRALEELLGEDVTELCRPARDWFVFDILEGGDDAGVEA